MAAKKSAVNDFLFGKKMERTENEMEKLDAQEQGRFHLVALSALHSNPRNRSVDPAQLSDLAADIRQNGLIHAICVRDMHDGTYRIVSGHRRKAAYDLLRSEDSDRFGNILCDVRELTDEAEELLFLAANLQTEGLSHGERMESLKRYRELFEQQLQSGMIAVTGDKREYIAKQVGLSPSAVTKYAQIDEGAVAELREMLEARKLTLNSAYDISKMLPSMQRQFIEFLQSLEETPSQKEIKALQNQLVERENAAKEAERARRAAQSQVQKLQKRAQREHREREESAFALAQGASLLASAKIGALETYLDSIERGLDSSAELSDKTPLHRLRDRTATILARIDSLLDPS